MKEKKKLEIEELISKLDLTPTMHQYAVERYESLKDYLNIPHRLRIVYYI